MKLLQDILFGVRLQEVVGNTNVAIDRISFDSRFVNKFDCFVATVGTAVDGHQFIDDAIAKGAVAVICQVLPAEMQPQVTYIKVANSSEALGILASNFYDNPSEKLRLVGVTGTNGKTTTVTLLYKLFKSLGYRVGLLSTVVNHIDNVEVPATHTTPDPIQLNSLLKRMVDKKCAICFMEVSSHAIVQRRIAGLKFTGGVFSNITHDHLDYHGTFNEYIKAKKLFFDDMPSDAFALFNADDIHGEIMVQNCRGKHYSFALKSPADFKSKILEQQFSGTLVTMDGQELWLRLIGKFNVYNTLSVYAVGSLLGEDKMSILTAMSRLDPVEGRFQHFEGNNGVVGIVDYAHTPDALKKVLDTIKEVRQGAGSVITVVGCGGDRDKAKRPIMAQIACEESAKVILTSDNPRTENPDQIITDMMAGVPVVSVRDVMSITDRREAIKVACQLAQPGDVVLVAGKGHEKYQEINGQRHPFDDLQLLTEMLKTPA